MVLDTSWVRPVAILLALDVVFLMVIYDRAATMIYKIQHTPMRVKGLGVLLTYIAVIVLYLLTVHSPQLPPSRAFLIGASLYAVYEGTSYALFDKWSLTFAAIDVLWGGTLFALTTILTRI